MAFYGYLPHFCHPCCAKRFSASFVWENCKIWTTGPNYPETIGNYSTVFHVHIPNIATIKLYRIPILSTDSTAVWDTSTRKKRATVCPECWCSKGRTGGSIWRCPGATRSRFPATYCPATSGKPLGMHPHLQRQVRKGSINWPKFWAMRVTASVVTKCSYWLIERSPVQKTSKKPSKPWAI